MILKIKRLSPRAEVPKYAHSGDAAMDLVAISKRYIEYGRLMYGTGLALEIPEGYVGLLFPRSSIFKTDLILNNSVGVIDSGFRGEVSLVFSRRPYGDEYEIGDRVGQLIVLPYPKVTVEVVEELTKSTRGKRGYGSSGR